MEKPLLLIYQNLLYFAKPRNLFNPFKINFSLNAGLTNNPMSVCVKRSVSTSSFSEMAKSQTGTCTSSQKTCGNTAMPETVICVATTENCPIYNIKISSTVDLVTYPASDWTQITLLNTNYLYFDMKGSTATELPLSEFRFTQNAVCQIDNNASK